MKKIIFIQFLCLILTSLTFAAPTYYSAKQDVVSTGIQIDPQGSNQLLVYYTGYLFNQCKPDIYGRYTGNNVNVLFIFPKTNGENLVIKRQMSYLCQTPWNYNSPTIAQYGDYGQDLELWDALLKEVDGALTPVDFELAFEFEGEWDSKYGINYHMNF